MGDPRILRSGTRALEMLEELFGSIQISSVQVVVYVLEKAHKLCALYRLSNVSRVCPLKQVQYMSDWRWSFLVLSWKIVEQNCRNR